MKKNLHQSRFVRQLNAKLTQLFSLPLQRFSLPILTNFYSKFEINQSPNWRIKDIEPLKDQNSKLMDFVRIGVIRCSINVTSQGPAT